MSAHQLCQSSQRVAAQQVSRPDLTGRTANGLRVVLVGRSDDGDDVVVVCDRHYRERWFSGIVARGEADRIVCARCLEEARLHARRALILDGYGPAAWLRVLGGG